MAAGDSPYGHRQDQPFQSGSNPYAVGRSGDYYYNVPLEEPGYAVTQPEYESPSDLSPLASGNGFIDNPASAGAPLAQSNHVGPYYMPVSGPSYAQRQHSDQGTQEDMKWSADNVPSAQRNMTMPLYDHHNNQGRASYATTDGLLGTPSIAQSQRGGEDQQPNDFYENQGVAANDLRWADNPRRFVPPNPRPRTSQSPSDWRFYRPFDQLNRPYPDMITGTARRLNGHHLSMADHRRDYEILGVNPQRTMRNTYRLDPSPWDEDMVDMPSQYTPPQFMPQSFDGPARPPSYRLP